MTFTLPTEPTAAKVPCEFDVHPSGVDGHEGPAWALVGAVCPGCGMESRFYICAGAWAVNGERGVGCGMCQTISERDDAWRVVRLLVTP